MESHLNRGVNSIYSHSLSENELNQFIQMGNAAKNPYSFAPSKKMQILWYMN